MSRSAALACLIATTVFAAGACSDGPANDQRPAAEAGIRLNVDSTGAGNVPGALSDANTLPTVDRRLRSVTSLAARITYTSTSGITDGHTLVTGTVFAPKGQPPEGGWPIIAFGHPTTGTGSDCAPSLSPTLKGQSDIVTLLVKLGYVVTVSDYQGLGLDKTYHPYLDSTTAGYNLIDSVRAVRKLIPEASDRWLAMGTSQGGQAAWAANELAQNYGGGLILVGSISVSPPADIVGFADAAAAGELTKEQQPALQSILAALKNEYPDFNLDDYRRGVVADKWDVLGACEGPKVDERASVVEQITPDDLRPGSPEAVEVLRAYLQKMTLPQGPAAAPMLVIYGGLDTFVPAAWTDRAVVAACHMGDVIDVELQADKGHTDVDVSAVYPWIAARFNGEPASDSCGAILATQPTEDNAEGVPPNPNEEIAPGGNP
jgi:pimeloyl-ACP methyl ester carboxylesterase